jgi:regulator of sirC expression with transglutaminase-like and TPR domain
MPRVTDDDRRRALAAAVKTASRPGGLARACLLVARGAYPRLDPTASTAELARLAQRVRETMKRERRRAPDLVFSDILGKSEGFGGNVDYDDPEMSYLNRVLARRRGLPILVSVVWLEVARAAGVKCRPMGFPGHFVVMIGDQIVDPYAGGRRLTKDEVLAFWEGFRGVPDSVWSMSTSRRIVLRILANLASAYERRGEAKRLDVVLSDQLALYPGDPLLLARRGESRARFDDRVGALVDLNHAISRLPEGPEFERACATATALVRVRPSDN